MKKHRKHKKIAGDYPKPLTWDNVIVGFGCRQLSVRIIPHWLARCIIKEYHYSHKYVNNSRLHLGVFSGRDLVGVLQFGYAGNPSCARNIVSGTENKEYYELNRMWLHQCMPKNSESRSLSFAIKFIKITDRSINWIQSFADERCGRFGVVYQAANFVYLGEHDSIFYELDGETFHQKIWSSPRCGGKNHSRLRKNSHRVKKHRFRQFRYIYFIRKHARRALLYRVFPYPKPNAAEVSKARRLSPRKEGLVRSQGAASSYKSA